MTTKPRPATHLEFELHQHQGHLDLNIRTVTGRSGRSAWYNLERQGEHAWRLRKWDRSKDGTDRDGDDYLVDLAKQTCSCKGFAGRGRCKHLATILTLNLQGRLNVDYPPLPENDRTPHTTLPWTAKINRSSWGGPLPPQVRAGRYLIATVKTDETLYLKDDSDIDELGQQQRDDANAEFIVRACNNHAALLEACEAAVKSGQLPPNGPTLKIVLAAIAKATGGNS